MGTTTGLKKWKAASFASLISFSSGMHALNRGISGHDGAWTCLTIRLGLVACLTPHLLNSADDERADRCLAPESREVGVMERGVRRAGMRGAVMGATGRSAIPLLASGMLPGPPMVGAAGMDPYGLVLRPAQTNTHLLVDLVMMKRLCAAGLYLSVGCSSHAFWYETRR